FRAQEFVRSRTYTQYLQTYAHTHPHKSVYPDSRSHSICIAVLSITTGTLSMCIVPCLAGGPMPCGARPIPRPREPPFSASPPHHTPRSECTLHSDQRTMTFLAFFLPQTS